MMGVPDMCQSVKELYEQPLSPLSCCGSTSINIKMVARFCLHQLLPIIIRLLCMAIVSGYSRQTTHNIYLIFAPSVAGNECNVAKKKHKKYKKCPGNHRL
jgi:hypothetical protein